MNNEWLQEGKQSQLTDNIRNISKQFTGTDYFKVKQILEWIKSNLPRIQDEKKILSIFATRTASQIIEQQFCTACHDEALIFATLCRSVGIPSKYIAGISKNDPENLGHCVVEIYLEGSWILVDQSRSVLYLIPEKSHFHHFHKVAEVGLDSWDIGIDTFDSWQKISMQTMKEPSSST
jgi:hypothetical protein